jgi:hypothetical protein
VESNTSGIATQIQLRQEVFDDAKACFRRILAERQHRDCPRVVALLRPLTRHEILRQQILTPDVLQTFMELLDQIISTPGGNFVRAMDGLDCLVNCGALCLPPPCTRVDACVEELSRILIEHLGLREPETNVAACASIYLAACMRSPHPRQSRLERMLNVTGNAIILVVG